MSVPYSGGGKTWDADSGYHRGKIEWHGGTRYIRAGDDNVEWSSYTRRSRYGHTAMVYHAFAPNTNNCGDIRVGPLDWSWSNLPAVYFTSKRTCFFGRDNEWRAHLGHDPSIGTKYYFQHLFEDLNSNAASGEITVDTYWIFGNGSPSYHGKFCVVSSGLYTPGGSGC